MTDRTGAALLAQAIMNVRGAVGLTQRAKRKAAKAVWMAGADYDFTGWDVVDSAYLGEGAFRALGLLKGPTAGEVLLDMKTGEWPALRPVPSPKTEMAHRIGALACPACQRRWDEHSTAEVDVCVLSARMARSGR